MCPGHDKAASTPSEIIYGIWLGIGEGANVIISKLVIRLDSRLLRFVTGVF